MKSILNYSAAAILALSTNTFTFSHASADQPANRFCVNDETKKYMQFESIPGSNDIRYGNKILTPRHGHYKMIGRGRYVYFGTHSVTINFRDPKKVPIHFTCNWRGKL